MGAPQRIACAQCGATVEYRPDDGEAALTCPSCGHRQPIAAGPAPAKDDYAALLAASLADRAYDQSSVLTCATCGAATTVPATVLAERCPFCAAPTVTAPGDRRLRPAAVLRFALDEDAARAAVVAWEQGLWFMPGRLAPVGGAWQLSAVYLPYWIFDWDVTVDYQGSRGRRINDKTSWTACTGTLQIKLDGSTVFGSRGVGRAQGVELEPWASDRVVAYQDAYLQGVRAETSGLTVAQAGDLGHRLLERRVKDDIERDIGGDQQQIDTTTITYHAASVRLVLMPIWVTHAEHGGPRYRVLVNGESGEVVGERPVSRTKVLAPALAPLALAALGAVYLPRLLGWHARPAWQAHLLGFWLVLGILGIVGMVIGSSMSARAKRSGPARQRELYVARQGPGSTGLQVDPAAMWQGALQGDPLGRGTLVTVAGFAAMFVAFMPTAVLVMFPEPVPIAMMHGFSAVAVGGFTWAMAKAGRDRRKLLGLDDA